MTDGPIAQRRFTIADQELFASLSGDRNPMHMDALAARRTMASRPAVHGIHALLWGLETLFGLEDLAGSIHAIEADFRNFIVVEDLVRLFVAGRDARRLRARMTVDDVTVLTLTVHFGAVVERSPIDSEGDLLQPDAPIDLSFEDIAGFAGRTRGQPDGQVRLSRSFPAVSQHLGGLRLSGLALSSYVVGMICPGLHSIYGKLALSVDASSRCDTQELAIRTTSSDPRFRRVDLAVSGCGWVGVIGAFARPRPVAQASYASLAAQIAGDAFANTSVLVIGGSRGLGELIAKIAAAGGAAVTLTYSVGEVEACCVRDEITALGGTCDILRYDVLGDASSQLAKLRAPPDEVYYCATPQISSRQGRSFSKVRLDAFASFYVSGFYELCFALRRAFDRRIASFYPSSVFVEERPAGLTEYAMAKAAGEILCNDMPASERPGPILVRRLPRLPTDQTASLRETAYDDSVAVMLQVVRDMRRLRTEELAATGTAARRSS